MKIDFKIPDDKLKHLEMGMYIVTFGVVGIVFTSLWSYHLLIPTALYSAAVGRELYNKYYQKRIFDWMDIFATTSLGGFLYFIFLVIATFTDKI